MIRKAPIVLSLVLLFLVSLLLLPACGDNAGQNDESQDNKTNLEYNDPSLSEDDGDKTDEEENNEADSSLTEDIDDYNSDGKMDEEDYNLYLSYLSWQRSGDAIDINGDRRININDYVLYNAYKEWIFSSLAYDFNGDRKIDLDDYLSCKEEYDKWVLSDSAYDFNGDNKIDWNDYDYLKDPVTVDYATWVSGDTAFDFNGNGVLDEKDFTYYSDRKQLVGKFLVKNYRCNGNGNGEEHKFDYIYLLNSRFKLQDLEPYISDVELEISGRFELSCKYGDDLAQRLGEDVSVINNAIKSCKFDKYSDSLYTASFTIDDGVAMSFVLYLIKTDTGFSTSIDVTIHEFSVSVSFDMVYLQQ